MLAITLLTAPIVATQFPCRVAAGDGCEYPAHSTDDCHIDLWIYCCFCRVARAARSIDYYRTIRLDAFRALQLGVSLSADVRVGFVTIPDLPIWFNPVYYSLLLLSVTASCVPSQGPSNRPAVIRDHHVSNGRPATQHEGLTCSVLSVGHGNAVVVQTFDNRVLLFDAGAMHRGERTADTVCRFLWNRGYRMIDAIVISHPDLDHYNAVASLLERMPVGHVLLTNEFVRTESPLFKEFSMNWRHCVCLFPS